MPVSQTPPRLLSTYLLVIDLQMLLYWALACIRALGAADLPDEHLYADYEAPLMVAWNWSFLPMDIVLSATGLVAVYRRRAGLSWRGLAAFSLALTFCAGLMAISFWAIRREFSWLWWGANMVYVLGPIWFLPKLGTDRAPDLAPAS
ncbi:MAG: DUF5360 family protein [Myxococcales bacterium]|nr:DUF5360 family protein [Myxococcales bacterium]